MVQFLLAWNLKVIVSDSEMVCPAHPFPTQPKTNKQTHTKSIPQLIDISELGIFCGTGMADTKLYTNESCLLRRRKILWLVRFLNVLYSCHEYIGYHWLIYIGQGGLKHLYMYYIYLIWSYPIIDISFQLVLFFFLSCKRAPMCPVIWWICLGKSGDMITNITTNNNLASVPFSV